MAKKNTHWVQVGKRELELSNLDKILFPDDGIVKAQVIEYYLRYSPHIAKLCKRTGADSYKISRWNHR